VYHFLEERGACWKQVGDALFAVGLGKAEPEAARNLALCDLSGLSKLGVRGPAAEAWLRDQGLEVPATLYETRGLPDGGLLVRVGGDQFLLESGLSGATGAMLAGRLGANVSGAFRVERQEATFLLVGRRVREVLAQTCGLDFQEMPPRRLIFTRIAGVSGGILPEDVDGVPAYRLWIDPSYAVDLWESLVTITEEMGGRVIGAAWRYPELSTS
jgi:glycine cleavage system aminomethyltransferase T